MQLYSGRSEWTLVVRRVFTPGIFCGQSHRQWNLRRVALGVPLGIPPVPRRFSGRIDLQPPHRAHLSPTKRTSALSPERWPSQRLQFATGLAVAAHLCRSPDHMILRRFPCGLPGEQASLLSGRAGKTGGQTEETNSEVDEIEMRVQIQLHGTEIAQTSEPCDGH